MTTLPDRKDKGFPDALKKAREAKRLSYSDLARLVGIHPVMPSRYENNKSKLHVSPSLDTWRKLNEALCSDNEQELAVNTEQTTNDIDLVSFSIEQLIGELKRRGAKDININWNW